MLTINLYENLLLAYLVLGWGHFFSPSLFHSLWANISGCFWQVNNSEIRRSILLPETKADMLCLSVLGWMKAYELRNTLTLQWCARLLPPDRPPNLWKTFQCDFDCYYFFYFCFISRDSTVLVRSSVVACEVLPAVGTASQLVPQYMFGKINNLTFHLLLTQYPSLVPCFPFVGLTTRKLLA